MKQSGCITMVLGLLLLGASCAPPRHAPRPPKPPRPPRPPHGAVQFSIPDTSFQQRVIAFNN